MKYLYFPGCKISHHLPAYGSSAEAVCAALDIELLKPEFNCCGWPARHESEKASLYSAMVNFALAEQYEYPIVTPCKCCFGHLKYVHNRVMQDEALRKTMKDLLAKDGYSLPGPIHILHLLPVVGKHIESGLFHFAKDNPLSNKTIACHYGCHALRPGKITDFDDPLAPSIFERVMEYTGATTVQWDLRLECCGYPLRGRDERLSDKLMIKKFENASSSGADIIATACTYCQIQFEQERSQLPGDLHDTTWPTAVTFTQLLELALGLKEEVRGMWQDEPQG